MLINCGGLLEIFRMKGLQKLMLCTLMTQVANPIASSTHRKVFIKPFIPSQYLLSRLLRACLGSSHTQVQTVWFPSSFLAYHRIMVRWKLCPWIVLLQMVQPMTAQLSNADCRAVLLLVEINVEGQHCFHVPVCRRVQRKPNSLDFSHLCMVQS